MNLSLVLSNFHLKIGQTSSVTTTAPTPHMTPGVDVGIVDKNITSADNMSVRDVLQAYDLRNIDRNSMFSFIHILQDKKAISDETASSLTAFSLTVFGDEASNVKKDFSASVQAHADKAFSGPEQLDGMVADNLKHILSTIHSIDFARQSGAEAITVDVKA